MKRGDYAALVLFAVQAAFAFYQALYIPPVLPGLGDHYFNIPLAPLTESLSLTRTLGYPAFHALMAHFGWGLESYPTFQMMLLIPCVFVFGVGLRAYGLTGLAALAAVSPLLWIIPVEVIMPETLAKCFAIATASFVLWAAGTRRPVAYAGLAAALFLACQMRPAFLFLVVFVPFAWLFLYTRRWGMRDQFKWMRHALATATATCLPLVLFCTLRLLIVGHFGLVSFGGQNTVGIAIEMLSPQTIERLPVVDRPLALAMHRARVAWPSEQFLSARGVRADWPAIPGQYVVNVNRIGRSVQGRFPLLDSGGDNVARDRALSRMSTGVFRAEWRLYGVWLAAAAMESTRVTAELLLGGGGDYRFGPGIQEALLIWALLAIVLLLSWPLERRAFGEGSRPQYTRAVTVVLFLALVFYLLKILLVILVEPPIARYVQAAAFLLPCAVAALLWDRAVVLAAALCHRPHWYSQCLADYPAVPDAPRSLHWRSAAARVKFRRRGWAALTGTAAILLAAGWWTTRDDRLFDTLARQPERVRQHLLQPAPPLTWRDRDGATILHYAALHGDAPLVAHLLASGADAAMATAEGATALHWAALGTGGSDVVEALAGAGLSAGTAGPLGLAPLHLAALSANTAALEALLAGGTDPDLRSPGQLAPLHLAASTEIVNILLEYGADVNARDGAEGTPLHWAHTRALASHLLARGADINARENWSSFVRRCTPLHKAVYQNDLDAARWWLEKGADPNGCDINDFSPLYYAVWRKNRSMAALLLDSGADPNHPGQWVTYRREEPGPRFTDIYGKTLGRHPRRETFSGLVPDGAVLRPLDWSAFTGNQPMLDLLLERGADLALHNDAGMSALHWAVLGGRRDIEQHLVRRDPGIARPDDARLPIGPFKQAVQAAD